MKNNKENIAIVGYGTIGKEIYKALIKKKFSNFFLVGIMDIVQPELRNPSFRWVDNINDLIKLEPDLIIESAGADVLKAIAEPVIKEGIDLMPLSVAAFAEKKFEDHIKKIMSKSSSSILLPSGAIGCLDNITAACTGKLANVVLTQRKPSKAILPEHEAAKLTKEKVISRGTAREIALKFPKTSNIAAALALSGPGLDNVIVEIVADPKAKQNSVNLYAEGDFGKLNLTLFNKPTANLSTSKLAYMSIIAALERRIGNVICPA
jgi:aspartate dehydrogenase